MDVALAEWQAGCAALCSGAVSVVIRKGGIHERGGGLFQPEHEQFALFPTYEHQQPARLRPALSSLVSPDHDPLVHVLPGWAQVTRVWRITALDRVLALGEQLMFSDQEIQTRFHYRDQPFLYVLLLRVHVFQPAPTIPHLARYAGCRSWIKLDIILDTHASSPVLDEAAFDKVTNRIQEQLS